MKTLIRVVLVLLVLIGGALAYVSFQPSEYNVSRSQVIKVPVSMAYNTVNDLRTWERWGPWHDEDTTIVVTYGDKTAGVGGTSEWTSKDGPGNMKIVSSDPNKSIEIKLQFADFEPSDLKYTFEEVPEGTKVTWIMTEDDAPFVFKMASAFTGGWDKMLGSMQEQGLQNLDKVMNEDLALMNSFRFDEVKSVELNGDTFIGYHHKVSTDASIEDMTMVFMESMPKAGMYAESKKLKAGEYTPSAVYTKWDEETKEGEMYIGLYLTKKMKPAKGMKSMKMPKKAVMIRKYGNYGNGDLEAHKLLNDYIATNNLKPTGLIWEMFSNDPVDVKPQDIQTDIYFEIE